MHEESTDVFVCEAETSALAGICAFLTETSEFAIVGRASSTNISAAGMVASRPDLGLLEHSTEMRSTIQSVSELALRNISTKSVLWSGDVPEVDLIRAFRTGAKGFIRKAPPLQALAEARRNVHSGEIFLEESVSPALRQWTASRKSAPPYAAGDRCYPVSVAGYEKPSNC